MAIKFILKLFFAACLCFNIANARTLTLMLDWYPNPNHAPIYVAQEQGFFKEKDLDIKIITPSDPTAAALLVALQKVDIGLDYEPHYVLEKKQNLPIQRIANLIPTPLNTLVTLDVKHIQTLTDLKNKTIAGSSSNVLLKKWLHAQGLAPHDVTLVSVHYNLLQALLSQKVEAVSGMMRNVELLELDRLKIPYRAFYPEKTGVPCYAELLFIVSTAHAQDPWVTHFIDAIQEATLYLKAYPHQAFEKFKATHPALNNDFDEHAWLVTVPYFADNPHALNDEQALINFMK